MTRLSQRAAGFSLVELAMVLFIVSLLIGGLLMPLSAQNEIHGRQETDKALVNIREALIGFAVVNGRLPCPANPTTPTGTSGAGIEASTGTAHSLVCTYLAGVLPWATLGLPESDFWGNRYTYRVNATFSRGIDPNPTLLSAFGTGCSIATVSEMPTKSAFALCTKGDISVKVASGGTDIATEVPAIVVSHGKNILGAYSTGGTQISGASGDEFENADGNTTFVSSGSLDDQLIWIPGSILMGRMLAAGKLP